MKKILVTLVAMCASFFAMASAPISSTSFEELVTFNPTKDDVGGDTATYWGGIAGDSVLSNYSGAVGVTRPDLYNTGSNTNYLYLDTSNDTLDRYVNALDAEAHAPQAIGTGLYFDSLVQFTASDTPVEQFTVATGDKLAVWLLATEDDAGTTEVNEASTNLVVTAGYLGYGNVPTTKSYVISNLVVAAGSWHRLTIKAIGKLGTSATAVAGFVVFVDGTAVTSTVAKADATGTVFDSLNATAAKWNTEYALFPSIVPHDALSAQTLSSVSFKGTGAIDDLVFTTQAPIFAVDAVTFSLNWDDGVNAVAYKLALEDASWTPATSNIPVSAAAGKVYLQVQYKSGYEAGTWTTDEATFTSGEGYVMAEFTAPTTISIVSKQNLFQVGEDKYATFAEALAAASSGSTIKLTADVTTDLNFDNTQKALVIDLAGNNWTGSAENPAIMVASGSTLTIIDSVGGGVISGTYGYGIVYSDGTLTIGAVEGDAGARIDGLVIGAVFVKGQMTVAGNEDYAQNGVSIAVGSTVGTIGDYYVVTVSGGQPEIPTYALTLPSVTGATAAVTTNGVAASTYTAIESNAAVVVTWTAQNGYKIKAGATESFTMNSAKTAATPTVVAITYATVTITPVDNCAIAVSNGNAEVVSGAKFDVEDEVVLSVTRTPAEGYELTAGYAASENITATNDVTITAAVQAAGPTDWPTDTSTVTNQTASAAFGFTGALAGVDAAILSNWAKGNGNVAFANAGTILTDAFLLNCANTTEAIATAAADFKITSITVDGGTVTIEPANFGNGKVVIKGAATLGDTFVDPVTTSHRFFKGALAVPTMPE